MKVPIRALPRDRLRLRISILLVGLVAYGVSDGLLFRAGLGVDPWDVFQQGLARTLGLQVGTWSIVVGAVVLLAWWPLRQRPGWGTLANVVVVGMMINLTVSLVPAPHELLVQVVVMVLAVVMNGVATGAYIGAGMGPGPRDGLTVGLAARGYSIRVVRSVIELSVLGIGYLLGGSVGIGTLVYAGAIGPLAHVFIPLLAIRSPGDGRDHRRLPRRARAEDRR